MARSRLEGDARLIRILRRLPEGATEGLRKGIADQANSLNQQTAQEAPNAATADALQVKIARDGLSARVGLVDKRNKRKGFLGYIFEFGAEPHLIETKALLASPKARPILTDQAAGKIFGKRVKHPGISARPWFAPAVEKVRPQIVEAMRKHIADTINRFISGL